ncbi:DUF547 domain-containing protein [Flavicella sp.]|uniref:DUF547 domain-containing protein n=1 Tax=Flavicella sp. TaxID=2957742 RepID=UPI00260D2106|nr:DUF547 domain-containing protein [Flavicella sp.]MDG1804579.1 DUF547 domain-containing protein [Flavicella sp.]
MKLVTIWVALLFVSTLSFGQEEGFDKLLKNNITEDGVVNYKGIIKERATLDAYIDYLKETNAEEKWSDHKAKAFYINAYNAYTILLIIDNYPLKSIMKINKGGKDAWHQKFVVVGGKTYSLNDIEHEILRKKYSDPRIHVGVNCASFSCPPIANFAFTEANVEAELERLMKKFINDPARNVITAKKITLSKIFEWYKGDFIKNGSLVAYINGYTEVELTKKTKVRYMEYNWNLNE